MTTSEATPQNDATPEQADPIRRGAALRRWLGWTTVAWGSLLLLRCVPVSVAAGGLAALLLLRWATPKAAPPPPAKPRGTRILEALLLAASVGFSLVVVEVAVRLLIPVVQPPARGHYLFNDDVFTPHPRMFWCLEPDSSHTFSFPSDGKDRTFTLHVSSQGLRNPPVPPKANGEFRVVMIGDSFTLGWGVEEEFSVPRQLERFLATHLPDKRVTVINAGVSGYGPWQELLMLEERGFPLDPDLVILQVLPANDVANTLFREDKYLHAYVQTVEESALDYKRYQLPPFQAELWVRKHLRTYAALMRLRDWDGAVQWLARNLRFLPEWPYPVLPDRNDRRPPNFEVDLRQWYPELEEGWNLFTADILRTHEACRSREVDFLAYCLPPVATVCDTVWQNTMSDFQTDDALYERGKIIRRTEDFFRAATLSYVGMVGPLTQRGDPYDLYIPQDGHLSERGTAIVAEALGAWVLEHRADPR